MLVQYKIIYLKATKPESSALATSRQPSPPILFSMTSLPGYTLGYGLSFRLGKHVNYLRAAHCAKSSYNSRINLAQFQFGFYGKLLKGAIEATFSMTHGAGAFTISPTLKCCRIIPKHSKVWDLVHLHRPASTYRDWKNYLDQNLRGLEQLFRDGRASPQDVDSNGQTLLHVGFQRAC